MNLHKGLIIIKLDLVFQQPQKKISRRRGVGFFFAKVLGDGEPSCGSEGEVQRLPRYKKIFLLDCVTIRIDNVKLLDVKCLVKVA